MKLRKGKRRLPVLELVTGAAILLLCFGLLTVRLEVTREGYKLSELRDQMVRLEEQNRELRLEVTRLTSHERLRALAERFQMGPPEQGQIVELR